MGQPRPYADQPVANPWHRLKRFLAVRMLAAAWRARRAPAQVARARAADREDRRRGRVPPPAPRRKEVRSVVWVPCGPGGAAALLDTLESLARSDGDASQVVVVDDWSGDAREVVVRERFPAAVVFRPRLPSGGPPGLWGGGRRALEHALAGYAFEQFVKLDTDAIVTGPGFSATTLERIAAAPGAGIAGCCGQRADGQVEDRRLHVEVLAREARYDRTLAAAAERARDAGWPPGHIVQGGVFCVTREACERLARDGWLGWRRPWWSTVSEDLAFTLFVAACGLAPLSIGGPDGVLAVGPFALPLPKEELAGGPWVAVHSVHAGRDGESEAELREFFRAARASWPASRGPGGAGGVTA